MLMRDFLATRFNFLSKLACFFFGVSIALPLKWLAITFSLAIFFDFLSMKFQKENGSTAHK